MNIYKIIKNRMRIKSIYPINYILVSLNGEENISPFRFPSYIPGKYRDYIRFSHLFDCREYGELSSKLGFYGQKSDKYNKKLEYVYPIFRRLLELELEYGFISVPCKVLRDEKAIVESRFVDWDICYAPWILNLGCDSNASLDEISMLLAESYCDNPMYQPMMVGNGKEREYSLVRCIVAMKPPKTNKVVSKTNRFKLHESDIPNILKKIEPLFDNYNNRVLEEYEVKKNDVGYQYRHDWNPANLK